MSNLFAQKLAENIPGQIYAKSTSGVPLFFEESMLSDMFAAKFDIDDVELFNAAFQIVTSGVGDEIRKINSVASSALLSLLIFYPLFVKGQKSISFDINGQKVVFDKSFFEVRNMVVRRPSCVDVVLQSKDGRTLLFLESKLSEFIDSTTCKAKYGKSYYPLYDALSKKGLIGSIKPVESNNKMMLLSDKECYIEGIKQSISHLIGILRGPKLESDLGYPKEYLDEYLKAYRDAESVIYGTMLYNPNSLCVGIDKYDDYVELYSDIIGKNGDEIVNQILSWKNIRDFRKKVVVLKQPLTYHTISEDYLSQLSKSIRNFYKL